MTAFEPFHYKTLEELRARVAELGADLPLSEDLSPLGREVRVGNVTAPNAIAILPMEGCDSQPDGAPGELTRRRYRRLAAGGAGLIWYEACAVVPEGRANPLQLSIRPENVDAFAAMLREANAEAERLHGRRPVSVLQLTHSGRYCRPTEAGPAPMIPQHDPLLDPRVGVKPGDPVVTDEYLDRLQEDYVRAALLAKRAGFDGVDIKSCHRYLLSELLASHTRAGKYGGSFENRSRFLLAVVDRVREAVGPDFLIACRLNVFDAHPYPYGFGVDKDDPWRIDLAEPLELVRRLARHGVGLLSNSAGNPYYRYPQVTRPLDQTVAGGELPGENPLESCARLYWLTAEIQRAAGDVPVIGNGYSWLRQFLPNAAAANLAAGRAAMAGLGREAFAYPDAPSDILNRGGMEPRKCCVACSKCTQIMRDHGRTGCVVRDGAVYAPIYKECRERVAREG